MLCVQQLRLFAKRTVELSGWLHRWKSNRSRVRQLGVQHRDSESASAQPASFASSTAGWVQPTAAEPAAAVAAATFASTEPTAFASCAAEPASAASDPGHVFRQLHRYWPR